MADPGATWVVGTAGHVDHGKTTLIRALTGVDLDTRPEERTRGITIALGFVPLDLPSGQRVAFVDVPGHERLVRTMIAGATGIDAALLCVSAQDGVMPQTREHLHILQLLGVSQGIIALTKADLVDEELLELAAEEIAEEVEGTFLEGAPIVPVSAIAETGLDALRDALEALQPESTASDGPFRLPVDRAFSPTGFGTVVTGTAWSGQLAVGDTVRVLPGDTTARVRGLQTHGESVERVRAGWRVAVNLSGVDTEQVPRGVTLTTGDVPAPHMIDVRLDVLASASELEDGAPIRFLVGTAEALGRLHLAADLEVLPVGHSVWAQVRLDEPVAVLPGDRFVLRRTSPLETLGGGVVVDPWAPRLRRKGRVAHGEQIARLLDGDLSVWLERAGELGLTPREWEARLAAASGLRAEIVASDPGLVLGERRLASPLVARLEGALMDAVDRFHVEHPLYPGAGRRELLRDRLGHLEPKVFDALVARLVTAGALELDGARVRRAGFSPVRDAAAQAVTDRLLAAFAAAALEGLTLNKAVEAVPGDDTEAHIRLLEHEGRLVAVERAGWLHADAIEELRSRVRAYFADARVIDPPAFKELTGLSRRVAIPLLEWMDLRGWTTRVDGERVRGDGLEG